MAASTFEHEPRLTALYASLMTQWARQTVQYSRSVRLYQEGLHRRRAGRLTASEVAGQPKVVDLPPTSIATLDAPNGDVVRPRLDLVVPSPSERAEGRRAGEGCPLTARQREIAGLIAQGLTNGQIAARIVVSRGTVGNHVGHMLRRLGVKNRAQIAAWAIRQGTGDRGQG
ncbi:MAG TPA: helix-turn-helix transcriptional regulator [Chloroflexota bacterium]|nr:helix-turn-helix transcriptional regulator [Chloroflexota bacterium]